MSGGGYNTVFCADGKYAFSIPYNSNYVESSILFMRTGIIEVVDARMMNYRIELKETYQWCEIEKLLSGKLADYSNLLDKLDIPKPWYISVCITNGKGYWTSSYGEDSEMLHSDYIQAVDVIWNDGQALNDIIQPCFDSLANAFGFSKSFIDFSQK